MLSNIHLKYCAFVSSTADNLVSCNSYFRTVTPSRASELTPERLAALASEKLILQLLPHYDVIPIPKLKHDIITRAGWVQPPGTAMPTTMRVYYPDRVTMFSEADVEHLDGSRTIAFREAVMGCRWDVDCGGRSPTVKVWDKGAEPPTVAKKAALPAAPYLPASTVKKALNPPMSYEAWERKRIFDIDPASRLCIVPMQEDSDGVAELERFPTLADLQKKLTWVTSSSVGFDPDDKPVHLVLYNAACTRDGLYDARALEEPFEAALKLMVGLLKFEGTVGIIIMPGNTPAAWIPNSLQVAGQKFICLV